MEKKGDGNASCNWCTWNNPQRIGNGTGRLGNKMTNRDRPDNCNIKIGQNIEKSPGDLMRLTVTQTPVKKTKNKKQKKKNTKCGCEKTRKMWNDDNSLFTHSYMVSGIPI